MTDQLISFKTAKLAKEKGFTWDNGEVIPDKRMFSHLPDKMKRLPTQSLLQRWLREEHGIHIQITKFGNMWDYNIESDEQRGDTHSWLSDSYEKTLETALQNALNLI